MAHDTFEIGDLTAVIGDNEPYDGHEAGSNGIHRLVHRTEPVPLFVPAICGFNLEHIFDGDQELRDVGVEGESRQLFFEPRKAPMTFRRLSESEAELYQAPTPTFKLESWTRFRLVAPHFIDFSFRCKPTQDVFRNGYIGLFWASYINAPEDKSMYFREDQRWQQLCTQRHYRDSTVVPRDDSLDLTFTPDLRDALYKSLSPLRFDEPFFYGLFRQHMLIVMFESSAGIRFTHSPSGGGTNTEQQTTNPAWDFQFIIPTFELGREYGFRARAVYRERCSRAEVLKEFQDWKTSQKAPGLKSGSVRDETRLRGFRQGSTRAGGFRPVQTGVSTPGLLRRATPDDSEFVYSVKKAALREYVEQVWGWDEEEQRRFHQRRFAAQDFRVISLGGTDVGTMAAAVAPDCLKLNGLFLLPAYQGQGTGGRCMSLLMEEARRLGLPIRLQVMKVNLRARVFYERLGFTRTGETETHYLMEWLP